MNTEKQACHNGIKLLLFGFLLLLSPFLFAQNKSQEKKEKQKPITEEIVVEAELPRELPLSTTSFIKREKIEALSPQDLSEVLSFTSGTFVSAGTKGEYRIKIRGLESQQITLLYDGIPIYEPFFNSFDLKTLPAGEVETVKIIKGASSVLYGPNTLGGVVNIITRRPNPSSFSLTTAYDSNSAYNLSTSGSIRWRNVFFSGFTCFDKSDGFKWKRAGENILRDNSDYERGNITGKVYFYPSDKSEILIEASQYWSEFGIPIALEYYKPRYWRFKSWNRFQVNLGGTFSLFKTGYLKFRSYYVRHDNILDAYNDSTLKKLSWESTYNNDSYGAFLLGSLPYIAQNELKFSFNFRDDNARTQDDKGKNWERFSHQTFSMGLEDNFQLSQKWTLAGGVSVDYLKKSSGDNKTSLNPVFGIKYNPDDYLGFHITYSQKSRFPSMKALYSTQGGNPELRDERGTNLEFGFKYDKYFILSGAIFYNRIRDLIHVIRLPDGSPMNLNIGRSRISGFELEFQKAFSRLSFSLNYTYLKGKNKEDNRPLDLLPESQLNFIVEGANRKGWNFTLWGIYVSSSELQIGNNIVNIPDYFVLNAILEKSFSHFSLFLKGENLFNKYYTTEPGYPMKSRTFAFGIKVDLKGDNPFKRKLPL